MKVVGDGLEKMYWATNGWLVYVVNTDEGFVVTRCFPKILKENYKNICVE